MNKAILALVILYTPLLSAMTLHEAAETGDLEGVKAHIAAGSDLNEIVGDYTPLHYAASNGHLNVVAALLNAGADPNVHNEHGETALHYATSNAHLHVVAALLEAGADPNALNNYDETALHYVFQYGAGGFNSMDILKILQQAGLDPTTKSTNHQTALSIATRSSCAEIIEFLTQWSEQLNIQWRFRSYLRQDPSLKIPLTANFGVLSILLAGSRLGVIFVAMPFELWLKILEILKNSDLATSGKATLKKHHDDKDKGQGGGPRCGMNLIHS